MCYDTTFNIGNHYLSTILAKNIELSTDPMFPIAFYIHDRKRTEDHHAFLQYVFDRLNINSNIPIVTDREQAFSSFFASLDKTKDVHFSCTNHILADAKAWVRANLGSQQVDFYKKSVQKLVKSGTLEEYVLLRDEGNLDWETEFANYFKKNLDEDLMKNFRQIATKRFSIFNSQFITNNLSEAFHSAFKRVFNAESIRRTEEVLISLYIYQAHCLQEFEIANDESGDFDVRPEFKHFNLKLNLPYYELDFDQLVKTAKDEIGKSDPQVLQRSKDNWSERQLANFVIEKNKFDYSPNNGCLIVGHPFFDDQCQIVKLTPNGVFSCQCRQNPKVDCFHIIVAKYKTGHKNKISEKVPCQKLSSVQRSKTFEKKGGKKQPRALDLDPEVSLTHRDFKKSSKGRFATEVQKSDKTYSKKAKHDLGKLDDFINNDLPPLSSPVDDLKSRTLALSLSPMVSENFEHLSSELPIKKLDVILSPPRKTFDVELAYELLLSPSHPSNPSISTSFDTSLDSYAQKYSAEHQEWYDSVMKETFAIPEIVKLDHNYAAKENLVYHSDLKCSLEYMPEVRTVDSETGLKSNPDLAKFIKMDNWLLDDIVNECSDAIITLQNKYKSFFLIDSNYYQSLANSFPSDGLYNHLYRWQAASKNGAFVIINTDLQKGFHWMLGYILFDKRTITVCDPLLDEERDYKTCFCNLFRLVKLVNYLKGDSTQIDQWKFVKLIDICQQPNTWDCGTLVCYYIKQILSNKSVKRHLTRKECAKERDFLKQLLSNEY